MISQKKKLKEFSNNGFVEFKELLDKSHCNKIYKKLLNDREWGKRLFKSEKNFLKNPQFRKTNPGKGKFNLAEKYNLKFIENNRDLKLILSKILGKNYEIKLKKFVVAVPDIWIPSWLKKKVDTSLVANLGSYIKKKYRDVTYFRGIDYHMDQIDFPNETSDFITMYIYLNDTTSQMSPLNIVKKSHVFGATKFPHAIKDYKNLDYLKYGPNFKKQKNFKKQTLLGQKGTTFIWTSLTLHGTQPQKDDKDFRISLRYLIKKSSKNKQLIDDIIQSKNSKKSLRTDINFKTFKQVKFNKILK